MALFTSTTHATYIPEQWADESRVAFENALVLVKLSKHIEHDKKTKGDVIHIPDVSNVTAADLSDEADTDDIAGMTPPTEGEFTLTINKKKHVSFYIPKYLGANFVKYELRAPYTKKIGYGLAKVMDSDLFALWSGFTKKVGTTADGLEGNISDNLILAVLEHHDTNDVPDEGRVLVLPARQKSKLLAIDKFVRADAVGPGAVKIEQARFGEIYSYTVYFTNNCPTKAAATAPATTVDSLVGYGMARDALAIAIPQDISIDYVYIPQKKKWFLSGDCLYGVAMFRDISGCVAFTKATG